MANTLTAVIPKLLAQGLDALREFVVFPRLVNNSYSEMAGQRGSSIEVPVPSAITANNVVPATTSQAVTDVIPTSVSVPLNNWVEAAFTLTDKEVMEAMDGTIPMQATAAIRALANKVDQQIIGNWQFIPFSVYATTASTPFDPSTYGASDNRTKGMTDVANLMAALTLNNSPLEDRRVVVDPIAYGNLVQMRAFQDLSWSGSAASILDGQVNRKMGFDWFQTQNLPTLRASGNSTGTDFSVATGGAALGATSVPLFVATGETFEVKKGDIVTFTAAGAGQYSIQADVTSVVGAGAEPGTATATVTIWPPLRVPLTTSHALVYPYVPPLGPAIPEARVLATSPIKGGIAFHRDAIAFATRPISSGLNMPDAPVASAVDPESGLTLRLEIRREHRQTRFAYDILWGSMLIRPELAVRYEY